MAGIKNGYYICGHINIRLDCDHCMIERMMSVCSILAAAHGLVCVFVDVGSLVRDRSRPLWRVQVHYLICYLPISHLNRHGAADTAR